MVASVELVKGNECQFVLPHPRGGGGDEVKSKGSEVTWAAGQAWVESVDEERWLLGIESQRRKNAKEVRLVVLMFRRQCYFFGLFAPILGVLRNFRHFYSNRRLFTEILVINTCFYCLLFEAEILIVLIFTLFPFLSVRGREFAEGALREAYVVSRVREGDTSQFVPSFDQICTSRIFLPR